MLSNLLYAENLAGGKMIAKAGAQVRTDPSITGNGTFWMVSAGDYVILTGYFYEWDNVYYYQTTYGLYAIVNGDNTLADWTPDGRESVPGYTQTQAQALVDKIIKCNKQIIANNLLCARYADKFTPEQRQQIRDLQTRLQARNQSLIEGGYMKEDSIQTGYPEGYAELAPYMDKLMAGEEAIGVATWVVVVVACVVVASLSTAAYYAYRYMASEAEKDVKFSKELTAVLAQKLTPEEYQMLLDETKGIVTKSRIKQAISTGGMSWVAGLLIGGGLLLCTKFMK